MKQTNFAPVRVGDHSGQPPRDIAPERTPVTIFEEDGTPYGVVDIATPIINAFERIARQEGVPLNVLLSQALLDQLTRLYGTF